MDAYLLLLSIMFAAMFDREIVIIVLMSIDHLNEEKKEKLISHEDKYGKLCVYSEVYLFLQLMALSK